MARTDLPPGFSPAQFKKGVRHLSKSFPAVKKLEDKFQLKFEPHMDRSPYESLVRAIAHQQLHGKAATTILNRFLYLYPKAKFPTPQQILETDPDKMRMCGFSQSKVLSIRDIAQKALDGVVPGAAKITKMDNDEIIERLVQIRGVGRWTVEMLLIFQLGRLDVWPVDDFGVRRGYQLWKRKKDMPTAKELKGLGSPFAPYQSIVALYLWKVADAAKTPKVKGKTLGEKNE